MITTFGEIMLRITPNDSGEKIINSSQFRIIPGGSESNVAIALAHLGKDVKFVTILPDNELAYKIGSYLKYHNVQTIIIKRGTRVGVYWTEVGVGPRNSFVIYDRECSAFSQVELTDLDWNKILEDTIWFHFSGISPAVSHSIPELLKKAINACQCPYSVDLNYRNKLWSWINSNPKEINAVMTQLCDRATLIAGNESDFTDVFGISSNEKVASRKFEQIAAQAFERFPDTQYISISHRISKSATQNDWNGYLFVNTYKKIQLFKGIHYSIDNIVDRVGTGDSFVAGIIYGLNQFASDYQKTIDFAVTLSALNHTTRGDASCFTTDDVYTTMKTKGSGRILR